MRASERNNEQPVLPSLWPDGAGYGLDFLLKGADLPRVWPGRGAYAAGHGADPGRQAQAAEAEASPLVVHHPQVAHQPLMAHLRVRWASRGLMASLPCWVHRLLGQCRPAGVRGRGGFFSGSARPL